MTKSEIVELLDAQDHDARPALLHQLVLDRGAAVAQAWLGRYGGGAYYEPDQAPAGCPFPQATETSALLDALFGSVADDVPTFVRALHESCRRALVERTAEGSWRLLYFLERARPEAMNVRFPGASNRYEIYMGGAPAASPSFGDEARAAGWNTVPAQVAKFAAVHDGFGPHGRGFGVEHILPLAAMEPLNDQHPEWLEARCDSVGNRRILLRNRASDSLTRDWDHETHQTSDERTFFAWIDGAIAFELLDLDPYDFPRGLPEPPLA